MKEKITLIFLIFYSLHLYGDSRKDTSENRSGYRIKGIDFRYGFGKYNLSMNNELNLVQKLTNDQNNNYHFDEATAISYNNGISDLYLGFVLVPTYYIKNKLFYKEEFRIGISYSFLNSHSINTINFDTIQTSQQKEVNNFEYLYQYNSESINFSYLLNSRILKKSIAVYGGLGASLGFVTWRTNLSSQSGIYRTEILTLQNNTISRSSKVIPLENFSTGILSLYIPIGIKYNLSCDINLFTEAHFGVQYYFKGLSQNGTWIPNMLLNFGFRFKLIDDEVARKETNVFW